MSSPTSSSSQHTYRTLPPAQDSHNASPHPSTTGPAPFSPVPCVALNSSGGASACEPGSTPQANVSRNKPEDIVIQATLPTHRHQGPLRFVSFRSGAGPRVAALPREHPPPSAATSAPTIATTDIATAGSSDAPPTSVRARVALNGMAVDALFDTGAAVSLVRETLCLRRQARINKDRVRLVTASGESMTSSGRATLRVTLADRQADWTFVVVPDHQLVEDVIIGMDLLAAAGTIIDARRGSVQVDGWSPLWTTRHGGTPSESSSSSGPTVASVQLPRVLRVSARVERALTPRTGDVAAAVAEYCDLLTTHSLSALAVAAITLPPTEDGEPGLVIDADDSERPFRSELPEDAFPPVVPPNAPEAPTDTVSLDHLCKHPDFAQRSSEELAAAHHKVQGLIKEYQALFVASGVTPPVAKVPPMRIQTYSGSSPIVAPARRLPPQQLRVAQEEVKKMLDAGVIKRAESSSFRSNMVLVRKKDGSCRPCIDYRPLNKETPPDQWPMPRIDEILEGMHGAKFFTTLDAANGYWQIAVHDSDQEKTAFAVNGELYQFTRMPFGLRNAPAIFQRIMQTTLHEAVGIFVFVYIDDVVVFSRTFEEHLVHLRRVFDTLVAAGISLRLSKCHFIRDHVLYLGHQISPQGLRPDPAKTEALRQYPQPQDKAALRRFLGFAGYMRRFVPGFARLARPLNRLLGNGPNKRPRPFEWSDECSRAFHALVTALSSPPVLALPDFSQPFELCTDASDYGIGAALMQDGRPIAYYSRTLDQHEEKYATVEKECLAVVAALEFFQPYVRESRDLIVVTDHQALHWLFSSGSTTDRSKGRLARWALRLQSFDFTVRYRPGRNNVVADALSRAPPYPSATGTIGQVVVNADPDTDDSEETLDAAFRRAARSILSDPEALRCEQHADATWAPILQQLAEPQPPGDAVYLRHFVLNDQGVLFFARDTETIDNGAPVVCLPLRLRFLVLSELHDNATGGHLGVARTYERLRRLVFWPRMRADVQDYIRSCDVCSRRNAGTRPASRNGLLRPIITEGPGELVLMDFMGPLPATPAGNRFILVIIDHFTRWPEVYATPDQTASTAAKSCIDYISRHGVPRRLLSDNGPAFVSDLLARLAEQLEVSHSFATPYHPQTNGTVERFNRTLKAMLASFANERQNWDELLPALLLAYRSARNESTHVSPFLITYGREARLPTSLGALQPPRLRDPCADVDLAQEFAETLAQEQSKRYQQAGEAASSSKQAAKRHYDGKHKTVNFDVGAEVWLFTPDTSSPSLPWHGPFVVVERVGDLDYKLRDARTGETLPKTVHAQRLCKRPRRPDHLRPTALQPTPLAAQTDDVSLGPLDELAL